MKIPVLILLLCLSHVGFCQSLAIDVKADYLVDKTATFAIKENGKYSAQYLSVDYNKQSDKYTAVLKPDRAVDLSAMGTPAARYKLTAFSDIKKTTASQMLAALNATEFTYPKDKGPYRETYSTLNFAGNYAVYRTYKKDKAEAGFSNETGQGYFFNIVPVTVNDAVTILFLFQYQKMAGYIIPIKDGYSVKLFANGKTPVTGPVANKAELDDIVHASYPAGETFTANGKTGIREKGSKSVLVPAVYDSVITGVSRFTVAYKGGRPTMFFNNGDPLAIPNLRAVYNTQYSTTVIAGNAVKRVDKNGKLTDAPPEPMYGECGTVPSITNSIEVKFGVYTFVEVIQYGNRTVKKYRIAPKKNYKSLAFLNQQATYHYMAMGSYGYHLPGYCFIFETADGKKGIVQIDYTQPVPVPEIMLAADNYTFKGEYPNHPLRFMKKGLTGFWPQNSQAKYSELTDFDKGFARFKTAAGTYGWLGYDGKEYVDE